MHIPHDTRQIPAAHASGRPRHLIIVAREQDVLYTYLLERFEDDRNVQVILDRRTGERRHEPPRPWRGADRRRSDRRTHTEIEEELQSRSHAILSRG